MNKTLIIKNTNAGFFSNFRTTVSTIKWCNMNNYIPYVLWDTSIYNETSYGPNAWEYYFEQVSSPSQEELNNAQIAPSKYMSRSPEAKTAYIETIKDYITIKKNIISIVDNFCNNNFLSYNMLGVHIRRTDKLDSGPGAPDPIEGLPVDNEHYIKHINMYLNKNDNTRIFLATDCLDTVDVIKENFGDKVCLRDTIRSKGNISVHHHMDDVSPYKKGEDVLIDALILSRCNFLIKGTSSVAVASLLFNEHLKHENLNYLYNNDNREIWAS